MKYLLLLLISFAYVAQAKPIEAASVDKLSLELKQIENKRDPFFTDPDRKWQQQMDLLWDIRLYKRLFFENDMYLQTANSVVRHVGWKYKLGIEVFPWLDVIKDHHSRHDVDEKAAGMEHFPLEDSYGIRINFISK